MRTPIEQENPEDPMEYMTNLEIDTYKAWMDKIANEQKNRGRYITMGKTHMRDRARRKIAKPMALDILDELEAYRRRCSMEGMNNADHALRVAAAMIARRAGFDDRMTWCKKLRENPESEYAMDREDPDFDRYF